MLIMEMQPAFCGSAASVFGYTRATRRLTCSASQPVTTEGSTDNKPARVAIAGAGVAGLSTALALLRTPASGVQHIALFEPRTGHETEVGAALNLNGAASILTSEYNLDLDPIARRFTRVIARAANGSPSGGRVLMNIDIERAVRSIPAARHSLLLDDDALMMLTVMREELQLVLMNAVLEYGPSRVKIHRGAGVRGAVANSDGALKLELSDGRVTQDAFDLVIGADGVRSTVRTKLLGFEEQANYSGICVYFGITPPLSAREREAAVANDDGIVQQWFGDGGFVLQYAAGGGQQLFAFAFRSDEPLPRRDRAEKTDPENVGYKDDRGVRTDCERRMRAAGMPDSVMELFARCDRFIGTATYFHDILPHWSSKDGRVVVVGDAAHAMPPFLGQGANQAVQDAHALAVALSQIGIQYADTAEALQAYERVRRPPTSKILTSSRAVGFVETQAGPIGMMARNLAFTVAGATGVAARAFITAAIPRGF